VYFLRFLRLGLVTGAVYWSLFRWVFPFLVGQTPPLNTPADLPGLRGVVSVLFLVIVWFISLVTDYVKVRAVVEDRYSMLSAIAAALRFVARRPLRTLMLFLMNAVVAVAVAELVSLMAIPQTPLWRLELYGWFVLGVRVVIRLGFMASSIVFFQSELAHAGYTAAPQAVWPDSAAAEAIANLTRRD
jgi:hypothetical protein